MTFIGKSLVFLQVIASLLALALAGWTFLDRRDRPATVKALNDQIKQKQDARDATNATARSMLRDPVIKDTLVPAVTKTESSGGDLFVDEQAYHRLSKDGRDLQARILIQLGEIQNQRKDTRAAQQIQKGLTADIEKPLGGDGKQFRAVIDDAKEERKATLTRIDELRPFFNTALYEMSLVNRRYEQLIKRLEELKGAATAATPGP